MSNMIRAVCGMAGAAIGLAAEPPALVLRADFDSGYAAQAYVFGTNGAREATTLEAGISGGVQWVEGRTGKAVCLHATPEPGDALYYRVRGLVSPFLGTLEFSVKVAWKADDGKRHVFMDLRNRDRTGYLLEKNAEGKLSFSAQEKGRMITDVTATNVLCDGAWHTVRAVWHTEGLKLFVDGVQQAGSQEAVIPSAVGPHLFVGSCYEAVDQLDGVIDDIKLSLRPHDGLH